MKLIVCGLLLLLPCTVSAQQSMFNKAHGCSNGSKAFQLMLQARAKGIPVYDFIDKVSADGKHPRLLFPINLAYAVPAQLAATTKSRTDAANWYYVKCMTGWK